MIRKLQKRFILIAVIALTAAMALVVGIVNIANYLSVRSELSSTLDFLSQNSTQDDLERGLAGMRSMGRNRHARNLVSESRWFSVYEDRGGSLRVTRANDNAEDVIAEVLALAEKALASPAETSFQGDYLCRVLSTAPGRTVVMLNCETKLAAVRTLGLISAVACLAGILLALLFVTLASRRAVTPLIRNMEKQKRFITDASHELKTPLTVISTNMELLQTEAPDNQWVRSTQKQTAQMRRLVDELVYLSRMEEESAPLSPESLRLNELLRETAEPFAAMAEFNGRELLLETDSEVLMEGDRKSVERLMSTLLDNALKYAEGAGPIRARVCAEGRHAVLTVSNEVAQPLSKEQCTALFDRFYRADPSRNKDTRTGFGIGLSIARAIAEKHGGTIEAAMTDGNRLTFTCVLPRSGAKQTL